MPPREVIIQHGTTFDEGATFDEGRAIAWELNDHPDTKGGSWDNTCDLVCREVARGRIVARFREGTRDPTRIAIVARPEGDALLVTDNGGIFWRCYPAPSVDAAVAAARFILASGSAFNW